MITLCLSLSPAAVCTRSPHVTLGSPFQWRLANGSVAISVEDCSFKKVEGNILQPVMTPDWALRGKPIGRCQQS